MNKNHYHAFQRVTILREILQLSQSEFAERIGISQGALSQIENGKTSLSMKTLRNMSNRLNVNCNWLINGNGEIFLSDESSKYKKSILRSFIFKDKEQRNLIPLVTEEAQAGYVEGLEDEAFLNSLNAYYIPGFEENNYRMFEIEGDSMLPGLQPRDIVICEFAENWEKIENGNLCILVTEEGVTVKRVYFYEEDTQSVILKSDNADYKTYSLPKTKIKEIWKLEGKITRAFNDQNTDQGKRLDNIEKNLEELRSEFNRMRKN